MPEGVGRLWKAVTSPSTVSQPTTQTICVRLPWEAYCRRGFWPLPPTVHIMGANRSSRAELIRQLRTGEIDQDEFTDRLESAPDVDDKEALWGRWSSQGLFDGAIDQSGFTRITQTRVEEVEPDG